MPTPLQLVTDPISLVIFALYGGLMLWETVAPARALPHVPGWRLRGFASFAVFFFLSSYLPMAWDEVLAAHTLFDISDWGVVAGAVAAVVVYEGLVYVWHRAMHRIPALWRTFHQMHHSAERIDTFGAFYFSPLDMAGWTALGSFAMVLVLGLDPLAATAALLVTTFLGMFQHANVATPRWLGFIVQRPESHTVHHARGVHDQNFSDLPIFDMLFGTFTNPAEHADEAGFYHGASARVPEMLVFRDVSELASATSPASESFAAAKTVHI